MDTFKIGSGALDQIISSFLSPATRNSFLFVDSRLSQGFQLFLSSLETTLEVWLKDQPAGKRLQNLSPVPQLFVV